MNAHLALNTIIHLVTVHMKQMLASLRINWHFKTLMKGKQFRIIHC